MNTPLRLAAARRAMPPAPAAMEAVLEAMPVPLVLLGPDDAFRYANQAAEQFLGLSMLQLAQLRLADLLPSDNPVFLLIEQARGHGVTIADHDLTLESQRLQRRGIAVQAAVLRAKLRRLDGWNAARRAAAARYTQLLNDLPGVRVVVDGRRLLDPANFEGAAFLVVGKG